MTLSKQFKYRRFPERWPSLRGAVGKALCSTGCLVVVIHYEGGIDNKSSNTKYCFCYSMLEIEIEVRQMQESGRLYSKCCLSGRGRGSESVSS